MNIRKDTSKELRDDVEKLVSLGKKKGYLTYDEVNSTLSETIDSSEQIDHVFDILDGKDIKVIDSDEEGSEGDAEDSTEGEE